MNEAELDLVERCMEQLYLAREDFTRVFYEKFFQRVPAARGLFLHDVQKQQKMLFSVLTMTFRGMHDPDHVRSSLEEFGHYHARYGVMAGHFPHFGEVFVETMEMFLVDQDHADLQKAWHSVYGWISEVLIEAMHHPSPPVPLFKHPVRARPEGD